MSDVLPCGCVRESAGGAGCTCPIDERRPQGHVERSLDTPEARAYWRAMTPDPNPGATVRMTDEEFESAVREGRTYDSGLGKVEAEARRAREREAFWEDKAMEAESLDSMDLHRLAQERDAAMKLAEEAERTLDNARDLHFERTKELMAELDTFRSAYERLTGKLMDLYPADMNGDTGVVEGIRAAMDALRSQLEEARAELSALCDAAVNADLVCWGPAYDREKAPEAARRLRVLSQPWDENRERSRAGWKLLDKVERLTGELKFANEHSLQAMAFIMNTGMVDWTEKEARSHAAFLRISTGASAALAPAPGAVPTRELELRVDPFDMPGNGDGE